MQKHLKKDGVLVIEVALAGEIRHYGVGIFNSYKQSNHWMHQLRRTLGETYQEKNASHFVSIRARGYIRPEKYQSPAEVERDIHRLLLSQAFLDFTPLEKLFAMG